MSTPMTGTFRSLSIDENLWFFLFKYKLNKYKEINNKYRKCGQNSIDQYHLIKL